MSRIHIMKKLDVPWIVIDGSIYTIEVNNIRGKPEQESIAFNIGDSAKYIVDLHNIRVKRDGGSTISEVKTL